MDVVGCDGYMVYVIVSVVVEAKSPGISGMNRPFVGIVHVEWNTYDGSLLPFYFCTPVYQHALA